MLIAKTIRKAFLVFSFLVSPFFVCFFFSTNEDFEQLSMKKDLLNQITKKWQLKRYFCRFVGEIFRYER